jgi:Asp-tRNA(Asn)/Glu-tRNA(Gln) amidotransferase A subunit family amidase
MAHDPSLPERSAVELRQLIQTRQISPVELLDACIARIEAVNPFVNAVTATCFERARREARTAERAVLDGGPLGLLHGLPMGVKDLEATEGLLTTLGSPLYRNHVPTQDNVLVARLRAAGAIVAGKTNVPELGAGANTRNAVWGATGNPFDPRLNAGGSSGGSAAALACDLLPVCTGSDTGGSLRIPAALCGVVGFRPSPGLVPSSRKLLGWTPISVVGPMGRTVADTCLQLAASVGASVGDPLSYPVDPAGWLEPPPVDLGSLRIGWTEDFGVCDVDPAIRAAFRRKIAAMRHLFARCDEVRFDLGDAHRCFDVLRAEAFVAATRDAYERDPGAQHARQFRAGRRHEPARQRLGAGGADAHPRALRRGHGRLRPHPGPHYARVALPLDDAVRRHHRRQAPGQLLPLAGADLRGHADHAAGHQPALRHRRCGHAVRTAGGGPLPRRPPCAGGGCGAGACVLRRGRAAQTPPRTRPPAARGAGADLHHHRAVRSAWSQ